MEGEGTEEGMEGEVGSHGRREVEARRDKVGRMGRRVAGPATPDRQLIKSKVSSSATLAMTLWWRGGIVAVTGHPAQRHR